ncbi:MAG: TonB-dependent receptor [Candidatus Eremiobacteraeota bacterium]|nr:TonB-dependent receptor [Candidatus Eremiobacteraeota bacterium]
MFKRFTAAAVLAALCTPLSAFAGTTGSLTGRVTDSTNGAPVAGAVITVVSASQSATATTDARGSYSFISLGPDTYTVGATRTGYEPQSQPGQTILADQSTTLNFSMKTALKVIATTHSIGAGSLVRAGTTSDVYSVNPAAQRATQALGGAGSLDQAYGAIASVPGVSVPSGQQGWYQSVFIRGGDYDQVAYEFDGVPVIRQSDGAPVVTLSALGQQEVQVYTGGTPATSDSPGLAGYINQVIKTGTSPGYGSLQFGTGGPAFYHKFSAEAGGATPDRRFSYYVGLAGADQQYRYGDQFNAVSDPLYFYPLNVPSTNAAYHILDGSCGSYPLTAPCPAPYGFQTSPGDSWTQDTNEDREAVLNLHLAVPHRTNSMRDDIQMLYVAGSILTKYNSSENYLGNPPVSWLDGVAYTGSLFAPPDPSQIVAAPFPSSPSGRAPFSLLDPNQNDGGSNDYGVLKFQYQKNINDRSYLRGIGYSEYTDWFLNGPNSSQQTFGATLSDYEVVGHIYGASLIYSNDLSRQHLLTASLSYQTQKLQTYNATFDATFGAPNTGQFGNIVSSFVGSDGHCYNYQTGVPWTCYDSTNIGTPANLTPGNCIAAGNCTPTSPSNPVNAVTENARWLMTENGQDAQVDNVTPYFGSLALTDVWRPNDKVTINLGARVDRFAYKLDDLASSYPARAFWFSNFNNEYCGAPGVDNVSRWNANTGTFGPCPQGYTPVNFVNSTGGNTSDTIFQPRIAGTYTISPYTVLRASYGKYARAAATSYHEYNTFQQDLPTFINQFASLGYTSPDHNVVADTSNNFDFSYEHRVPGTRLSFKVSPFYRTTKNQLQYLNISALGGTLAGINVGTLRAEGIELSAQLGDFSRDGLSAQLSYTYTNTRTRYASLSNGLNIIDVLNRSIEQYNSYTYGCSPGQPAAGTQQCGGTLYAGNAAASLPSTPTPGLNVVNPYYCQAANASCPYQIQPLMDPNASYVPYDVIPSAFASANSYAVPHVATLVLNYRKKKFAITPSFSYNSGSYYGSPLSIPGYVPQACAAQPSVTPDTPGVSCGSGGAIFIPDQYTGYRFDGLGSLKEPWQFTANMQLSYDISDRASVTLIASNIYNHCGQHGYAWDTTAACWYSSLPSNILPPAGNFLSNAVTPVQVAYPYGVWFNNTQVGISSARQPFQLTANLEIKL